MAKLDSSLTGSLPCLVCGYELQGLSIRGVCPECGTAVRATILHRVDPMAEEFRPITRPRLTAWCLVLWSVGALGAAALCWLPRLAETWATVTKALQAPVIAFAGRAAVLSAALSGLALLGVARPTRDTPWWKTLAMLGACIAYGPLVWSLWNIDGIDMSEPIAYFRDDPAATRIVWRLIQAGAILGVIAGVRPIARDLVKRSLVLRTGRVDRQTLLAMSAVVLVGAAGDAIRLWSALGAPGERWLAAAIGTLVVALASVILTLGMVSALIDSYRIHQAIMIPSPGLRQVIGSTGPDSGHP